MNSPPHPRETQHRVRLCCGNGLRRGRVGGVPAPFRIPQILEFYAATEGNFSLYNCEGKPGAIGRIPSFLAHRFPVALVKFDLDTGEPVRSRGWLLHPLRPERRWRGDRQNLQRRTPPAAGSKVIRTGRLPRQKVLSNVFVNGDAWFRTGDLMRRDESGYFYFIDRVGDTFRWKGENVSTTEVAETLSPAPALSRQSYTG